MRVISYVFKENTNKQALKKGKFHLTTWIKKVIVKINKCTFVENKLN